MNKSALQKQYIIITRLVFVVTLFMLLAGTLFRIKPVTAACSGMITCSDDTCTFATTNFTNDTCNIAYKGDYQSITLKPGKYKLEVWGASGGNMGGCGTSRAGGLGGYSVGNLTVSSQSSLYSYIGGQGSDALNFSTLSVGGYNGGGGIQAVGDSSSIFTAGGGATHIAKIPGLLSTLQSTYLSNLYLVAGGGGGVGGFCGGCSVSNAGIVGGYGGGSSGGAGGSAYNPAKSSTGGAGGTQTSGGSSCANRSGSFGQGGYVSDYGAGGGGGFYGGEGGCRAGCNDGDGGGGSGYIGGVTDGLTIAGNKSFPAPAGGNEIGHAGNGFARITILNTPPTLTLTSPAGNPWTKNTITVAGTVTDPDASQSLTIQYQYDGTGGTWNTLTTVTTPASSKAYSTNLTVSNLAAGNHTVYVRVTDGSATSPIKSATFRVDATKPTLTLNNGGTTYYNTAKATVKATDAHSGLSTIRYAWSANTTDPANITASACSGGAALTGFTAGQTTAWTSDTLTPASQGVNYLHVCVIDEMGNITKTYAQYNYDTTPPTCTTSGGSPDWTNDSRTITGTCADAGGSGCSGANPSYTYAVATDITDGGAGTNGAAATVTDAAGNTGTCVANQTVKIDKTPPTCTTSGGSEDWTNGNVTITGTCADTGGSGCTDDISYTYSTDTNTTTGGAGENGAAGSVSDVAGNTAACSANQTVKIDKTAPTCTVSGGSDEWTNDSRTITGTCSDTGGSGCTGSNPSYTYPFATNVTNGGAGMNGAEATVTDAAGNSATCAANQTVKIDKTAATCGAWTPATPIPWKNIKTAATQDFTIGENNDDNDGSGMAAATFGCTAEDIHGATCSATIRDNAGNTTICNPSPENRIDTDLPTVSIDVTGGEIREGTTYLHTPDIAVSGTDETSGPDGVKTAWLTGDGSGLSTIVGGTGVGGEGATTAANCETALATVEFYTTDSFVIADDGTFTLCAQSFDVAGNTSAIKTQLFSMQSPSVIYTEGFNVLHENCGSPANQYKCIYSAKAGESFTLNGTVLADPKTAPSNIKVCLEFTGVNSEEYPICTTTTTTASSPTNYTFDIPTSALPANQDTFISTAMITTDTTLGDTHTQPVHFILFVKRDTPPIVKQTKKNTYILMRNGRLN